MVDKSTPHTQQSFAATLRLHRCKAKITQVQLAYKLGYAPQSIGWWERSTEMPAGHELNKSRRATHFLPPDFRVLESISQILAPKIKDPETGHPVSVEYVLARLVKAYIADLLHDRG